MKVMYCILFFLIAFSSNAVAGNEMFSCDMEGGLEVHLIFSDETTIAELVLSKSSVKGSVSSNEHHYHFTFPKTNKRYETHININRYNGAFEWEIGSPPFGNYNMGNIFNTGTCTKSNVKKVL